MSTHLQLISPDRLRQRFSQAMSRMYRDEVPAYGALVNLTQQVNARVLADNPLLHAELTASARLEGLSEERHGAIRVGTAAELADVARLFALLGMQPVGYYDLSVAGLPVHSTAFRPVSEEALRVNAFRIFTSLLRLDLLDDVALRHTSEQLLAGREIFTARARAFIDRAEHEGGVAEVEADDFIAEVVQTFRWHATARADAALYSRLDQIHSLVADVVCFQGPHINHLTPRTLDIDEIQRQMPAHGMHPKETIEGPPRRACPILLRQTSFKAIEEPIRFPADGQQWTSGSHRARFGEVEQRGIALTRRGRALYDTLLERTRASLSVTREASVSRDAEACVGSAQDVFSAFPDDWITLREQQLAWFDYRLTEAGAAAARDGCHASDVSELLERGWVHAIPIVYEDFLPVSAAGIFRSNLGTESGDTFQRSPNRAAFEEALGRAVLDEDTLYAAQQAASIAQCLAAFAHASAPAQGGGLASPDALPAHAVAPIQPGGTSDLPRSETH